MKKETTRVSARTTLEIWNIYMRYVELRERAEALIKKTENLKRLRKVVKLEKNLRMKENTYYDAWWLLSELQITGIQNDLRYIL